MTPSNPLLHFLMQPDMENVKFTSYRDGGGVWTNGMGHTGPDVFPNQTVDLSQVMTWAQHDLSVAAAETWKLIGAYGPQQNEFDAFTSLGFNIGIGAEATASAVQLYDEAAAHFAKAGQHYANGNLLEAAKHFQLWDKGKVNGVLVVEGGLLKRRTCEALMLLGEPWQFSVFADETNKDISTATLTRCMAAYK